MSKPSSQPNKEIESLCYSMFAPESKEKVAESLEALMIGCTELQDEYCSQVLLEIMLETEFTDVSKLRPSVEWTPDFGQPANPSPSKPTQLSLPRQTLPSRNLLGRFSSVATVAVALAALCFMGVQYWHADRTLPPRVKTVASPPNDFPTQQMELRNHDVTRVLYQVSNTSWSESTQFPSAELPNATSRLSQGIAGLGKFNHKDAGGFIVALPPGAILNLTVHADAVGENALSVIGLNIEGQTTGEVVSFSNQANSATPQDDSTIYGRIGTWSEINDSPNTKFYLLAGLHNVLSVDGQMDWHVTDFRTFLQLPHLLHIGWDDTDWTPKTLGTVPPDKDYDDITVTVRIEQAAEFDYLNAGQVYTFPKRLHDELQLETSSPESEYPLTVPSGEAVILTVSSKADFLSELAVVERKSRQVWWYRQNKTQEGSHLGVFVIDNYSPDDVDLLLVGRHKKGDEIGESEMWYPSTYRKRLADDVSRRDHCQMIGFEDFGAKVDDYNDIRVNMHWNKLRVLP